MSLSYAADAPLTYSTLVNIPQRTGRSIGDIQVSSSSALKCLGFSDSYQSVCPSIFSTPIQSRCEMGARGMGGSVFLCQDLLLKVYTRSVWVWQVSLYQCVAMTAASVCRNLIALTNLTNRNTIWQLLWFKYSRQFSLNWYNAQYFMFLRMVYSPCLEELHTFGEHVLVRDVLIEFCRPTVFILHKGQNETFWSSVLFCFSHPTRCSHTPPPQHWSGKHLRNFLFVLSHVTVSEIKRCSVQSTALWKISFFVCL